METQILWTSIFGTAFLVFVAILAIFFPHPTQFQFLVFRTLLSLAAGGVASAIPGFLSIATDLPGVAIRAGGALAAFALVYRLNPASLISDPIDDSTISRLIWAIDRMRAEVEIFAKKPSHEVQRDQRDRLADYLDRIAHCVDNILSAAQAGARRELLHSCHELQEHAWAFEQGVVGDMDARVREHFALALRDALAGPVFIRSGTTLSKLGRTKLEAAARSFRTVAAALRT